MSFANQVAIITGASSGIGWELAKALSSQGCKVGLIARREDKLRELADWIGQQGGTAAIASADVGDRAQIVNAIRELGSRLGPVDLLMANAGVGAPTVLDPLNVADIETMFRVNTLGVIYAVEAVLPQMLERGRGHLAAVSSLGAYKGAPGESGYCASKAAVNIFMEGMRIHLRKKNIAVTTICPGFIRTPMTEPFKFYLPFLLEADDAARRIVRALERRRKVFNFPLRAALGMKFLTWLPDWFWSWTMRDYNENPPQEKIV